MKYHYSRKERMAMPNAPRLEVRHRKGVFRGNRSLLIVLLDVLLICLMFFLFRSFVFKPQNRVRLHGYVITLRCRIIKDSTYAAVRIKGDGEQSRIPRAFIEFQLGESVRQNSVALSPGERTTHEVTALLPLASSDEVLTAIVRMGDQTETLEWKPR
jgi:hypothetical protein